jgi:HEPN domain-containing protein
MHDPEEINYAFLIERRGLPRDPVAAGTEFHSRTIAFAQQAVEKLVKACLALRGL